MRTKEKHLMDLAENIAKKDGYTSVAWIYNQLAGLKKAMLNGKYYTRVDSVSKSGASRIISIAYIEKDELHHITHPGILYLAGCDSKGRIRGCGMDMLFAAQYNLFIQLHKSYKGAHYQKRMKEYNEM